MLNVKRMDQLVNGEDVPVNKIEELFLASYLSAVSGELLITYLVTFNTALDGMAVDELNSIMIGYSVGQNDLLKIEDELLKTNNKNPEGFH